MPVGSRHSNIAYHTEQLGTLWRKGGPWENVIEQKLEIEGNSEINFNNLAEHSISQFFDKDLKKLPDEENKKLEYLQELQGFFSSKLQVRTTADHMSKGAEGSGFLSLRIFDCGKLSLSVFDRFNTVQDRKEKAQEILVGLKDTKKILEAMINTEDVTDDMITDSVYKLGKLQQSVYSPTGKKKFFKTEYLNMLNGWINDSKWADDDKYSKYSEEKFNNLVLSYVRENTRNS